MRFRLPAALTLFGTMSLASVAPGATVVGGDGSDAVPIVLLRRSDKRPPRGSDADVLVAANPATDDIARRAAAIMADPGGFGQQALRLDRFVRTMLRRDASLSPARRAVFEQPAFLFLSDREGGYPADTFWFEQPDGRLREMRDVPFVDTVVRERDLAAGRVDNLVAIYAHELGHLMMAALAGPTPKRASTAMHFVTTRTDAWYAFTEGFGEHFQPVSLIGRAADPETAAAVREAGERSRAWFDRFAREQADGCLICPANLRFLQWHGAREQALRADPLRQNLFVHQVAWPRSLLADSRPPFEGRLYRDVAAPDPLGPLKNAAQMMESEGVIATLFYRIVTDSRLQQAYRDVSFYAPYLDERQAAIAVAQGPQAVVTPLENVYLKLFDVMHRSFRWGEWPMVELVSGYASRFPDERDALYDVFLEVTRGMTVEAAARSRHAVPGYLEGLRRRLMAGEVAIDGNLGPALWMVSPSVSFGMGVFRYLETPMPFTFDANAADVPDLRAVPGVSASLAAAVVRTRDERGPFRSAADLARVPGMTPDLAATFQSMSARMAERMRTSKPRTADAGWMKSLMVPVLRASYYVAGALQIAAALVLAGLAWVVTAWGIRRATSRAVAVADVPPTGQSGADHSSVGGIRVPGKPSRPHYRAAAAVGRGMVAAAWPCAASVGIYAAGVLPTMVNMIPVGVLLGLAFVVVSRLRGRSLRGWTDVVRITAATVAASAVIGFLY